VEICLRYKIVIKITNSRISALGPEGPCTSLFKRVMCISYRPHVDIHKRECLAHVDACGQEGGGSEPDFLWTS